MKNLQIPRDAYVDKLMSRRMNGFVKVITGIRRCGKSYLLGTLFRERLFADGVSAEQVISVDLDDKAFMALRDPIKLDDYVRRRVKKTKKTHYVFIDEIQRSRKVPAPGVDMASVAPEDMDDAYVTFYDVLNGWRNLANVDVYVTGSNSRFLSSDIVTEFRGRGDEIRVYPFSFAEVYSIYEGEKQRVWPAYCRYGGMPLVWSAERNDDREEYLKNLFEQVYLADIIGRYDLRGKAEIGDLVNILASSVGSLTNPLRLTNTFKSELGKVISQNTVNAYIEYLVDSFLVSRANRYDVKGLKYISSPLKYYFTDIGLRNARINFRQQDESHIMENIIYNELLRRRYSVDVGSVTTNAKNAEGKMVRKNLEVDFIANKGDKRYYIQSALELSTEEKWKQEERSLLSISDSFKKIVIQRQMVEPWYNNHGVLCISVEDFLLNQDSLDW